MTNTEEEAFIMIHLNIIGLYLYEIKEGPMKN